MIFNIYPSYESKNEKIKIFIFMQNKNNNNTLPLLWLKKSKPSGCLAFLARGRCLVIANINVLHCLSGFNATMYDKKFY